VSGEIKPQWTTLIDLIDEYAFFENKLLHAVAYNFSCVLTIFAEIFQVEA